jgi:hypothetical protein
MLKLWVVTGEIAVERGDLPWGNTNAFVNVVTWADSSSLVEQKVRQCLESYRWSWLEISATSLTPASGFELAMGLRPSHGDESPRFLRTVDSKWDTGGLSSVLSFRPLPCDRPTNQTQRRQISAQCE